MKYFAGILLLLTLQTANATLCSFNGGSWRELGQDMTISLMATITRPPGSGILEINPGRIVCKFTPDGTKTAHMDYLHTTSNPLVVAPKFGNRPAGLSLSGNRQIPASPNTPVLFLSDDEYSIGYPMNLNMLMDSVGSPGNAVQIRRGDYLGRVNLWRTTTVEYTPHAFMSLQLIADHDLSIDPSSCTINGNNPINVDFEKVDPLTIGDNVLSSTVQKKVTLNYSCPDPNITLPITITLMGSTASFNADAIAMSHADLGAGLIRNGVVVQPGKSFTTQLDNSSGSDEVTFSLIRKAGSYPDAGVYTGSATLVMGVP